MLWEYNIIKPDYQQVEHFIPLLSVYFVVNKQSLFVDFLQTIG